MCEKPSHQQLKQKIKAASCYGDLYIQTSMSAESDDAHLDAICDKVNNNGENPTVLWNIQPWNEFHIIHAIFCQKLCQLIEIGFNCTIILHDKYVENHLIANKPDSQIDTELLYARIQSCIDRFENAGLENDRCEILLESQLWDAVDTREFLSNLVSLSHITGFRPDWSERDDVVPFLVNHLCEIYYESIVDCDILLTGGPDVDGIWDALRTKEVADLLDEFTSPLILYYPILLGINSEPLGTRSTENSISVQESKDDIAEKLASSTEDFRELILNKILLWPNTDLGPDISVSINGGAYQTYDDMSEHATEQEILDAATEGLSNYFNEVQR